MSLALLSPVPILFLLSLVLLCSSDDQLTPAKPLIFPDDKLISNNGVFALGFFSPTNSSIYIGIWYNNIPELTVVWVANRDNPILTASSSATLKVTNQSDLVLSDHEGRVYWSTKNNITMEAAGGEVASATLVNEGSLVLRSRNGTMLWQSSDHPTDTLLPDMPLRLNIRTHLTERLVSWKGPDNPSSGNFSLRGDIISGIQLFIWDGSNVSWRSAAWNGGMISSFKPINTPTVIVTTIVANGDEISLTYSVSDGPPGIHSRMSHAGKYEYRVWNTAASAWSVLQSYPGDGCDRYASCGPFGYCDTTGTEPVPTCKCPDGFEPNGTRPSGGCARKEPLRCGREDHFVTLQNVKTPATPVFVRNRSFDGCAAECLNNCLCTAYAYTNLSSAISGGDPSRCLLWFGELVDMGKEVKIDGENLYLRLAGASVQKKSKLLKILLPIITWLLLLVFAALI